MRSSLMMLLMAMAAPAQPRLLTPEDFARMEETIARQRWAADVKANIVAAAEAWPQSHLTRYGLRELALPPEGGQWWHWYVCPTTGVRLRFESPNGHVCPSDNRRLTGWPYDQVIYSERHDALANAARDSALAWRLTGTRRYAENAAWILNAYAERYSSYALHDKDNRNTRTGGRAHSQTLDESIWLIPLAWAHDLLAGSDVLTEAQREKIERDLLRAAVATIQRYDAGISNWQSWHNAGIAAVAFSLNDAALIEQVIEGRSGFRFQMKNSVSEDGFWYEGSFTYHYYALDALMQTAEMAARAGIDLHAEERFARLFSSPARFAMPDGTLAPFNDATTVNLRNYNRWYESAFRRWGDPLFAAIAGGRSRGREALLWGEPELPAGAPATLESAIFRDSGYAVLRSNSDHTVILKYGPHGGGHGHYDKLNLVSYARGGILAVDPGTQAYSAPTHATWDKETVAHNTLVVDERTQGEATGALLASQFGEGFAFARAEAGAAYRNARLVRSLLVTGDYTLDVFDAEGTDGQEHRFDWVYHNAGEVVTDLTLAAGAGLPRTAGYQHLTGNRSAETAGEWQLKFDGSRSPLGSYGSVFASTANVRGSFALSREQVSRGTASGKLSYQFNGAGYLLYSTANAPAQPGLAPKGIKLMLYGDGSRHRVALRMNDATDERFVSPLITIDWTGWKEIEVEGPARWTHYLGNNDGVIDLPVRNVSFELQQTAGARAEGALFVDDVDLVYATDDPVRVAEFEAPLRGVRVWMLGTEDTTVVTGNGLGEDLTRPVPYVMARRRGTRTRFAALLEPFGAEPAILRFESSGEGVYVVNGPGWQDTIRLTDEGVEYRRD